MKTDEIPFTFVTAIVLTGALLAVLSPSEQNATASVPAANSFVAHSVTTPVNNAAIGEPAAASEVEISE